jgi:hypothetical protein
MLTKNISEVIMTSMNWKSIYHWYLSGGLPLGWFLNRFRRRPRCKEMIKYIILGGCKRVDGKKILFAQFGIKPFCALRGLSRFWRLNSSRILECAVDINNLGLAKWLVNKHGAKSSGWVLMGAIELGNLEMVKFVQKHTPGYIDHEDNLRLAAEWGHYDVAKWMIDSFKVKFEFPEELVGSAYMSADQRIINLVETKVTDLGQYAECTGTDVVFTRAVSSESKCGLSNLTELLWKGYKISKEVICEAAEVGEFAILNWLWWNTPRSFWTAKTFRYGARSGNLKVVRWFKSRGVSWNAKCIAIPFEKRNRKMFWWFLKGGCPIDDYLISRIKECCVGEELDWYRTVFAKVGKRVEW